MIPTITIVRGLPGSGKSTYAKVVQAASENTCVHVEADMFFVGEDGTYRYDPAKVKEAHEWGLSLATQAIEAGLDVVVSNTFTQVWEMQPYIDLAQTHHALLDAVVCTGAYGNTHGVPAAAVEAMRERWESWEGERYV